jgi:hypothetical protein
MWSAPSAAMKNHGKYVCLEFAVDECFFRNSDKKSAPVIAKQHFIEIEFKRNGSGKNITDKDIACAFALAQRDVFRACSRGYPIQPAGTKLMFGLKQQQGCRRRSAVLYRPMQAAALAWA